MSPGPQNTKTPGAVYKIRIWEYALVDAIPG